MYKFFNFIILLFFTTLYNYVFSHSQEIVTTRLLKVDPEAVTFEDETILNEIPEDSSESFASPITYIVISFIISAISLYGGIYAINQLDLVPPRINKEYKDFKQNNQIKHGSKLKDNKMKNNSLTLPVSIALGLKTTSMIGKTNRGAAGRQNNTKIETLEIADPYNIK